MGSLLEKNSTLVRKRIENHAFDDEQGEEYEASKFGGFADYMRRKKIKLQNLDAEIRANAADTPAIFRGVVVHVNGYTQPSLSDLHTLVVSHGGGFLQYLDGKTAATHVVASHLTPKKTVEFARYRIVKPAWIVDSVRAEKLLPWDAYRLVDEGVTQKVLGFENGQIVSQASTQKLGYRDQSDSSWYAPQLRASRTDLDADVAQGEEYRHPQDHHPTDEPLVDAANAQSAPQEAPPQPSGAQNRVTPPHRRQEKQPLQAASSTTNTSVPGIRRATESAGTTAVSTAEKRPLTAEEHNARLLSNPHLAKSSTANPDFLNQYYRESRLHHLSTWKADLKSQMQARAQQKLATQQISPKRAPGSRRYVLHVDFDSFFAAVSLRKHPHLVDKPVVIAHGSGPGSEIASCNYPARKHGIKNGMWMKTASGLCSDLHVLPYDYKAYEEASRHFYDSVLAVDGVVQSISIDEALVDVSDQCIAAGGSDGRAVSEGSLYREQEAAQQVARSIRASVKEKTDCEVSVGIGGNILLAKVALRRAKPAGQYLINPEDVLDFIGDLTVTDLPGVAWSIGNKLEEIGIKFVKDIRACSKERLVNCLGPKTGDKLWDYARGIDKQEVGDQVVRKSVSAEINWGIRFINQQQAEEFVQTLCDELSRRLLDQLARGKQLTMKIMRKAADAGLDPPKNLGHGKCDTFNKSVTLGVATHDPATIGKEAISILRSYGFPPGELRGLGVQMQKLEPLKSAPSGGAGQPDGGQRRLQFKKPPTPNPNPKSPAPPPITSPRTFVPQPGAVAEGIEDVPTPEKPRLVRPIPSAVDAHAHDGEDVSTRKPLDVSGTQFMLPSQVDPTVLADLPADIQNKLAPRQKTLFHSLKPRSATPPGELSSRSAPAHYTDQTVALPRQSQLDPDILAALPPDVRAEVLAEYEPARARMSGLPDPPKRPSSPLPKGHLTKSTKGPLTPTKKRKTFNPLANPRLKRGADASSTLTQSSFVSLSKTSVDPVPTDDDALDDVSESFLNELPEDIRLEIIADQKRSRMKARSGLNVESSRKRRRPGHLAESTGSGQQKLKLTNPPAKPTFTSQKLSSLPDLRDATSVWVKELAAEGEGPDKEDLAVLSDYLVQVVYVERDMAKAVAVINWLGLVLEYQTFASHDSRILWEEALSSLKQDVQVAVLSRGLPAVAFDC